MSEENEVIFGEVSSDQIKCLCVDPADEESALIIMQGEMDTKLLTEYVACKINNIIRCCNKIISKNLKYYDPVRLAFTDLFYRVRHEILFKGVCIALGLVQEKTDVPFSNFGIESTRTPDYIGYRNDYLFVLEVTATSSFDKGAQQKGLESAGFESKYKKEIDQLIGQNKKVRYIPLIFEMNSLNLEDYKRVLHENLDLFEGCLGKTSVLDFISKEFKIMTMNLKDTLTAPSSLLFSKPLIIPKDHKSIEFLYKEIEQGGEELNYTRYEEKKISPKVYSKIINSWNILLYKILRLKEGKKYKLIIDMVTNRLYFDDSKSGLTPLEWRECLESKQKNKVFTNTLLNFNGDYKQCIGSDSGYTFIVANDSRSPDLKNETIKLIKGQTLGHDEVSLKRSGFDYSHYETLSEINNEKSIIPNYYDENFEKSYFGMIKNLDENCMDKNQENYRFNETSTLLGECKLSEYKIESVIAKMTENYILANKFNENLPLKIKKMKSPFILPFAEINQSNYTTYKMKNHNFLNEVLKSLSVGNPFSSIIIQKTLEDNYRFGEEQNQPSVYLNEMINKRSSINREMTCIYKSILKNHKKVPSVKVSSLDETPEIKSYNKLKSELPELNKKINEQYTVERIKRNISMIRMKTKNIKKTKEKPHVGENFLTSLYKQEMTHFKDRTKQSTIEGVGVQQSVNSDYDKNLKNIEHLMDLLPINCGYNPDQIVDLNVYEDAKLLKECKKYTMDEFSPLIEEVRSSYLGHSSALVSRMAHSLLFYSQLPFNSDYIRVDNLGYKDVILIVKGGKKIFKTKSSKLYRMIYPINPKVLNLYINDNIGPSSYSSFYIGERAYLITPWMMLHESILNDSLSFYSRVTSFTILNTNPKSTYLKQYKNTSINVLLAYHNRRQTETLLANLRYILLSTIGEFSSFSEILTEFVGFNYDLFQAYIRNSIIINYPEYFKTIMRVTSEESKKQSGDFKLYKIKNIFTGGLIEQVDDLALMIYSTFLMTKAPYQRSVERANNLKGILKIHDDFKEKVGLNITPKEQFDKLEVKLCGDSVAYFKNVFENDYKFDPGMLTQLGIFADSYFKNRNLEEKIFTCWNRIINENWDNMATSTGLRGKIKDTENFWGKKGYFIVYKEIVNNFDYMNLVSTMLEDRFGSEDERRKQLRTLNQTYYEKIQNPTQLLLFHAVDKTQWRGGREIYVMDTDTKKSQQPIEKFMGELCKMLDNELISIPSDRRAQTIHHAIFEKDLPLKDALTYYLTLDCSKWAPKSIFVKFCLTLIPMKTIPNSFKTHFMNYIDKLYSKKVFFNNSEVEVLLNNPQYEKSVKEHLKRDPDVNGYYLEMPYSWIMGIFNYTSSFLHAINQKYMSYVITQTSIENYNEETSLVMFAHSDDSGGRISSTKPVLIQRGLIIYELGLKSCNHLLSRKKSTVSKIYFEILSIIYMFKKLLALLPKFLGGIRFLPTDKGMAQDMLQSYSKSIEVMVAGADFSVAYLVQKIYSMLVWKFYINRPPSKQDYERPVQYLGMPDSHPMITLIAGSDSDVIRIFYTKGENYLANLQAMTSNVFSTFNDEGPIRSIKFKIQIRNSVKGFEEYIDLFKETLSDWSIKNVNFKTTPFSLLNFLSKLNDPGFVGSLMNESPIRRISRSYFLRVGMSVMSKYGPKTLKFTMDTLSAFCLVSEGNLTLEKLISETLPFESYSLFKEENIKLVDNAKNNIEVLKIASYNTLKIYKYFDQITLSNKKILNTNRTLKPTHLEIIKTNKAFSVDFNPSQLVSYVKEEKYRWALPNVNNLIGASVEMEKLLDVHNLCLEKIDESTLLKLLNMFTGKSVKDIYLYSHVPSEIRSMRTYSSLLSFLSVNTRKGKEISGLVLKLQSDLTDPGYLPLMIDEEIYLLNTFLIAVMTISKIYGWNFIEKLTIKESKIFENEGGRIIDFLKNVKKKLIENNSISFILPILNYITQKIDWPNRSPTGEIFEEGSYYTFTKSQKLSTGWYGKGEIAIFLNNDFFKFTIVNETVTECVTNVEGKIQKTHHDFIVDILTSNDIYIHQKSFKGQEEIKTDYAFGYDHSGDLKVSSKREIKSGVECHYQTNIGGDLAHLNSFYVEHNEDNNFLLNIRSDKIKPPIKIRTLKILKGEILNTLRILLTPGDFASKLLESGIEDFDEFLLTEVLTHFGGENFIDFEDLIDNCQSSKLYEVMKWEQENDLDVDNKVGFGTMPGTQGSLIYTFLKYGEQTENWIVKQPKMVNRALLNVRSEYPENFTIILNEKIQESYNKLYDATERIEIRKAYTDLLGMGDQDLMRRKLVELMCYWGYSTLVNTIQCFSSYQKEDNYKIFRITGYDLKDERVYSDLFPKLLTGINNQILKFDHIYRRLDYPIKRLEPGKGGLAEIVVNNVKGTVQSLYNYEVSLCSIEIYTCKFLNVLHALFNESEFLEGLNNEYSGIYPLSLIPITTENLRDFTATYNTLKSIWSKVNKVNYPLNYTKMVERTPNNIPDPFKFYKEFTDLISPVDTYFHGQMNREFVNKIRESEEKFKYKSSFYVIKNKISNYSTVSVPVIQGIEIISPLNEEVFENPDWEDLLYESTMVDLDFETMLELWEGIEEKYTDLSTIIDGNNVEAEINWIIDIGCESSLFKESKIRQVGEFIVLLTTRMNILENWEGAMVKEIYLNTQGKYRSNLLVYIILPQNVDREIADKLFGKNNFHLNYSIVKELNPQIVRTPDGIQNAVYMGKLFEDFNNEVEEGADLVEEETDENLKVLEMNRIKQEMKEIVEEAKLENPSSESIYDNILKKYNENLEKGFNLTNKNLMESLLAELDLNELNKSLQSKEGDEFSLSKEQIISMHISPSHFGMTKGNTRRKPVDYKDKKMKAELESINPDLGDKIGSGSLTISPKYSKIIKANLEIWKVYVENTSYKQESKKFLWNLLSKICIDSTLTETNEDDEVWKDIIEKCVTVLADSGPDTKQWKNNNFKLNLRQGARLKYKHKGV